MSLTRIEVEQLDMKKAFYPDILEAHFGPCTVIGLFDPLTRSGYMIHEPDIRHTNLDKKLEPIRQDYENLSQLQVVLTGDSFFLTGYALDEKEHLSTRFPVEEYLHKHFSHVQIHWLPPAHSGSLYLYTHSGRFELQTSRININ